MACLARFAPGGGLAGEMNALLRDMEATPTQSNATTSG
jgi:hypothetical protein